MSYAVNAWNAAGKTPPDLPKGNLPEPTLGEIHTCPEQASTCSQQAPDFLLEAGRQFAQRLHETEVKLRGDAITKVLTDLYAVRGDPSREHTLVFHGTPDEFAFFKARLDEWARKRIT